MSNKSVKKNGSASGAALRFLRVCCIVSAVLLAGVLAMGFINNGGTVNNVTSSDVPSSSITVATTQPETTTTTTTTAPSTTKAVPVTSENGYRIVYTVSEVNVRSGASEFYELIDTLPADSAVEFIKKVEGVDGDEWCEVYYNEAVCYIHRDYLTTKVPATVVQQAQKKTVDPNQKLWYVMVVDKNRQLPDGYVPDLEYVADSECSMDARVAPYFDKMYEAALADGVELVAYSGYRSYETQEYNYEALVEEYMEYYDMTRTEAEAEAATEILPPGTSEHNLGLAMDIGGTDEDFDETEAYAWLSENAHKYGFIERYTEEKQEITGIIPEPWHWRFVGIKHATAMKEKGICLEEYLQSYGVDY